MKLDSLHHESSIWCIFVLIRKDSYRETKVEEEKSKIQQLGGCDVF